MMLPTHAVVGLTVAVPLLALAPDAATAAMAGALLGSVFPDLDLYSGHRRSLHFPTGYTLAALPTVALALLVQTTLTVALAAFVVGATLHCRMDRYGGGLELEPWEGNSERAVYDHVRGTWRRPKRWIRYDGAPEDAALLGVLGVPLAVILSPPFQWVVVAALAVGITYGLLRRRLASLAPVVFGLVPDTLSGYVPERYRQ